MCNCFWGNTENFIFDPKCKPSDTPDCDWHVCIRRTYACAIPWPEWLLLSVWRSPSVVYKGYATAFRSFSGDSYQSYSTGRPL